MAYLEIGKGVCHNASEGRRHSRGASIIEIGAACGTFIHGRRSHYGLEMPFSGKFETETKPIPWNI